MSNELPVIEERIDLKEALDKLVKNKYDAIQVMIYMTMNWKITDYDILEVYKKLYIKAS